VTRLYRVAGCNLMLHAVRVETVCSSCADHEYNMEITDGMDNHTIVYRHIWWLIEYRPPYIRPGHCGLRSVFAWNPQVSLTPRRS
jgi:hypothetical protein